MNQAKASGSSLREITNWTVNPDCSFSFTSMATWPPKAKKAYQKMDAAFLFAKPTRKVQAGLRKRCLKRQKHWRGCRFGLFGPNRGHFMLASGDIR